MDQTYSSTEELADGVLLPEQSVSKAFALDPEAVADALGLSCKTGLSASDAASRLAAFGPNDVERKETFSWPAALMRQFVDPLIGILLVAAIISAALGHIADSITIAVIVVLNGLLGFSQEWRAERALEALTKMLAPNCEVVRDGAPQTIDARELVPGDLVNIAAGARIPADLKLIAATSLTVDESALTGESAPVAKQIGADDPNAPLAERWSMVHAGTTVSTGRGQGIATATGAHAEFGRIAALAATVKRAPTPLQKRLGALGKKLGLAAMAMAGGITLLGVFTDRDLLTMFMTGVSLAVAAVPEGLPAVVALSLTIGVHAMAKRNALVRRLRAAETLGSATVICTDKTGTLTTGGMKVAQLVTAKTDRDIDSIAAGELKAEERAVFETSAICNDAVVAENGLAVGSPTEAALVDAAKALLGPDLDQGERIAEVPFSSERKRMSVVVSRGSATEIHMKGALECVAPLCERMLDHADERTMTQADRDFWLEKSTAMGAEGLRVIAVARGACRQEDAANAEALECQLTLVGLVGLIDPPRPNARHAVETAQTAGARVIMITGDSPNTAAAIADQVGLRFGAVLTGGDIDAMDDAQLSDALATVSVLSRTTPEHKLRVVGLLQQTGEIVAMTGDGVNDAPALKRADIGVAMGIRGTDAAKAAADMVLLDDDFGTIVAAMREGRRQDDNIRKFVRYLLASNLSEVIAVLVNLASGAPLILKPVQILWMNLVTDGATALALGMERAEDDVMDRPPREPGAPILDAGSLALIGAFGACISVVVLLMFARGLPWGLAVAQTMALTAIVVLSKASVLGFRSLRSPLAKIGWTSNPWLLMAIAGTIMVHSAAVFLPPLQSILGTAAPPWNFWAAIAAFSAVFVAVPELVKRIRARRAT